MQHRITHRVVDRAKAWGTAGLTRFSLLAVALSPTLPGAAAVVEGYGTGSGANTSHLIVDFGFTGGDAYVFEYRYDGEKTGVEMLRDLDAAGALDVAITDFSFGAFVDGFTFDGNDHRPGFEGAAGENFTYWVEGGEQNVFDFVNNTSMREAVAFGSYAAADAGPSDRFLADGSRDGWIANVSAFNSQGLSATNDAPAVPEPLGAAVLAGSVVAVLRRRR